MPGVPPDALDNVKRAFKGLFKRSKKSKTGTPSTSAATSQPPQSAAGSEAAAPQLPPIQNNSPLQSATETSKPLPPTHPLATGQREEPAVAVPPSKDVQPGPPAPIVGPAATAEQVEEQRKDTTLSPVSPSQTNDALDGTRSGDVSAVTDEASPKEPAKTDSGIEEMKVEEPGVTPSQPTTDAVNVEPINTTAPIEDKPTSSPATASAPNGTPAPAPTSDQPGEASPTSAEEKATVMHDEPPPIKAAKPAPGMSATSGPLEDFPEGDL